MQRQLGKRDPTNSTETERSLAYLRCYESKRHSLGNTGKSVGERRLVAAFERYVGAVWIIDYDDHQT